MADPFAIRHLLSGLAHNLVDGIVKPRPTVSLIASFPLMAYIIHEGVFCSRTGLFSWSFDEARA